MRQIHIGTACEFIQRGIDRLWRDLQPDAVDFLLLEPVRDQRVTRGLCDIATGPKHLEQADALGQFILRDDAFVHRDRGGKLVLRGRRLTKAQRQRQNGSPSRKCTHAVLFSCHCRHWAAGPLADRPVENPDNDPTSPKVVVGSTLVDAVYRREAETARVTHSFCQVKPKPACTGRSAATL